MVTIVLKYRKSFMMLLLCILWVVRHCGGCCSELHGIDEEWRGLILRLIGMECDPYRKRVNG